MGIAQRDYMRDGRPSSALGGFGAVPTIIGINIVVFVLWQTVDRQFMGLNFLTSLAHLRTGRVWTLVTSEFSHYLLFHIFLNMFVLYSFGTVLESIWGKRRFWIFYLAAAVGASLAHCGLSFFMRDVPALGASGAVAGVVMAYCLLFPRQTVLLFGIIPMPAMVMAVLWIGIDLYGLLGQLGGNGGVMGMSIGHGAHLGGAAVGALSVLALRMGWSLPGGSGSRRRSRPVERAVEFRTPEEEEKMDELLRKVQEGGLDSLTAAEREFLVQMSRRFRNQS